MHNNMKGKIIMVRSSFIPKGFPSEQHYLKESSQNIYQLIYD